MKSADGGAADAAVLINVDRAADRGQTVEGTLPLHRLPRLAAVHDEQRGADDGTDDRGTRASDVVSYALHFSRDSQSRAIVDGTVSATVAACCQRCLRPMRQQVSATVDAVLLPAGTQPTRELDAIDWIELEREAMNIAAFCDEELLLAMPVITRHDEDDEACQPRE